MKKYDLSGLFSEHNTKGCLISIVGFDCSGKTTQIEALANSLQKRGKDVVVTKQPTDWYRNQSIVQYFQYNGGGHDTARVLALMSAADRLKHSIEIIKPALEKGSYVIVDRYVYATFGVFLSRGIDFNFLKDINRGVFLPDHAFFLDVRSIVLSERLKKRDGNNLQFEEKSLEKIESITSTYHKMGEQLTRVDGEKEPNRITNEILRAIDISL